MQVAREQELGRARKLTKIGQKRSIAEEAEYQALMPKFHVAQQVGPCRERQREREAGREEESREWSPNPAHTLLAQLKRDKELRAANQKNNRARILRDPELQKVTLTDIELETRIASARKRPLDILHGKSLGDWFAGCSDHLDKVPSSGTCVLAQEMLVVYIFNTMQNIKMKEVSHPHHSAGQCV